MKRTLGVPITLNYIEALGFMYKNKFISLSGIINLNLVLNRNTSLEISAETSLDTSQFARYATSKHKCRIGNRSSRSSSAPSISRKRVQTTTLKPRVTNRPPSKKRTRNLHRYDRRRACERDGLGNGTQCPPRREYGM